MGNKKKLSWDQITTRCHTSVFKVVVDALFAWPVTLGAEKHSAEATFIETHKWNEAQFTKYEPFSITTIQRLLKYDLGINDTFQKSDVGTQ